MKNKLYSHVDRQEHIQQESYDRVIKGSIEYDPMNQIKKDLGLRTYKDEIDQENLNAYLKKVEIQKDFGGSRRIVDVETILDFCVGNGYTIQSIRRYRSDLTSNALKAISDFAIEQKFDVSKNKDNFLILAPRSNFKKDNIATDNIEFNIYYRPTYSENVQQGDNLIEVYGSNFNEVLFSPIVRILNTSSEKDNLYSKGTLLILMGFVIFSFIVLLFTPIGVGFLLFFNVVSLVLWLNLIIKYKKEFGDIQYINRIDSIRTFVNEGYSLKIN